MRNNLQIPPSVTIVILNWNGAEDTLACLESLKNGGYLDLPVIVVDNGSTDGSSNLIGERFPTVEIIRLKSNLGFTGGCNVGLARALKGSCRWICLLNNDTAVTTGFLETLLAEAARFPNAGILSPRVNYAGEPEKTWSQGITVNRWSGRILTPSCGKPSSRLTSESAEFPAVSGAAMLLSRDLLEIVGLFDDKYFLCFEDVDICLRAREKGFKVLAVPNALVYHRISASMGGEGSDAIIYYSARNQIYLLNRDLPLPLPLCLVRGVLVAGYTLLFVLITSRTPLRKGLRTWGMGLRDYLAGRMGKRRE